MNKKEEKIDRLMKRHNFNRPTAEVYVEARGICTYCGEDIFAPPSGLWATVIDHLLPKDKYPDLLLEPLNCVFSCSHCNHLKRNFDPLKVLRNLGPGLYFAI